MDSNQKVISWSYKQLVMWSNEELIKYRWRMFRYMYAVKKNRMIR